jgi:predicted nuclease of restriction endonuclease-like (RecB) superfamily
LTDRGCAVSADSGQKFLPRRVCRSWLENALASRITGTLQELRPDFVFVAAKSISRSMTMTTTDLFFFHVEQFRDVVIEPKTGNFPARIRR